MGQAFVCLNGHLKTGHPLRFIDSAFKQLQVEDYLPDTLSDKVYMDLETGLEKVPYELNHHILLLDRRSEFARWEIAGIFPRLSKTQCLGLKRFQCIDGKLYSQYLPGERPKLPQSRGQGTRIEYEIGTTVSDTQGVGFFVKQFNTIEIPVFNPYQKTLPVIIRAAELRVVQVYGHYQYAARTITI